MTRGVLVSFLIHSTCFAVVVAGSSGREPPAPASAIPVVVDLVRQSKIAPIRPTNRAARRTAIPHPPLPTPRASSEAPARTATPAAPAPSSAPPQPRPVRSTGATAVERPAPLDANGRRPDGTLPPRMGRASPMEDYRARVQAWLRKHRRYPATAHRAGREGRVVVHFVVDREGRVLRKSVVQGSGSAAMDRVALEVVRLAEPLPAMPAAFTYEHLELAYVMEFLSE